MGYILSEYLCGSVVISLAFTGVCGLSGETSYAAQLGVEGQVCSQGGQGGYLDSISNGFDICYGYSVELS